MPESKVTSESRVTTEQKIANEQLLEAIQYKLDGIYVMTDKPVTNDAIVDNSICFYQDEVDWKYCYNVGLTLQYPDYLRVVNTDDVLKILNETYQSAENQIELFNKPQITLLVNSAIYAAFSLSDLTKAADALANGANANYLYSRGLTALMLVCSLISNRDNNAIMQQNRLDMLALILNKHQGKINFNLPSEDGIPTICHLLMYDTNGHKQQWQNIALKMLLDAGADVNGVTNSAEPCGTIPLSLALQHGFTEIIKFLVDAGADISLAMQANIKSTSLPDRYARLNSGAISFSYKNFLFAQQRSQLNNGYLSALNNCTLIKDFAKPIICSYLSKYPLHSMQLLLNRQKQQLNLYRPIECPKLTTEQATTLLLKSTENICRSYNNVEKIQLAIAHGANINAVDENSKQTPLAILLDLYNYTSRHEYIDQNAVKAAIKILLNANAATENLSSAQHQKLAIFRKETKEAKESKTTAIEI